MIFTWKYFFNGSFPCWWQSYLSSNSFFLLYFFFAALRRDVRSMRTKWRLAHVADWKKSSSTVCASLFLFYFDVVATVESINFGLNANSHLDSCFVRGGMKYLADALSPEDRRHSIPVDANNILRHGHNKRNLLEKWDWNPGSSFRLLLSFLLLTYRNILMMLLFHAGLCCLLRIYSVWFHREIICHRKAKWRNFWMMY